MGSSGDFVSYRSIIFPVVTVIGVMSLELGICHHMFSDTVRNLTEITGFVLDFVIPPMRRPNYFLDLDRKIHPQSIFISQRDVFRQCTLVESCEQSVSVQIVLVVETSSFE